MARENNRTVSAWDGRDCGRKHFTIIFMKKIILKFIKLFLLSVFAGFGVAFLFPFPIIYLLTDLDRAISLSIDWGIIITVIILFGNIINYCEKKNKLTLSARFLFVIFRLF